MRSFKNTLSILGLIACQVCGYAVEQSESPSNVIRGMASEEIINKSQNFNEINPDLYQFKLNLPQETIYELVGEKDNLAWSLAVADIKQIVPHFHRHTLETYTVVAGILEVTINNENSVLRAGDVVTIPINAIHTARSLSEGPARILVSCLPAWTEEDHIIAETIQP